MGGIFADLLPMQVRLWAEAAVLAASTEEAPEKHYLRKHGPSAYYGQGHH